MFKFQVVGVMRNNVALMLERDQKLSELDLRAGMRHNLLDLINPINYGI